MPFVIGLLPLLGLEFLANEAFHRWMVFVCFGIAVAAFVPGWRKHRSLIPATVGLVGLNVIGGAAFLIPHSCCDSCCTSTSSTTAVNTEDGSSASTGCTDACCQAEAEQGDSSPLESAAIVDAGVSASWWTLIVNNAQWLTPLGGLLLITAHLLNHRLVCKCDCCSVPQTAADAVTKI